MLTAINLTGFFKKTHGIFPKPNTVATIQAAEHPNERTAPGLHLCAHHRVDVVILFIWINKLFPLVPLASRLAPTKPY